MHTKGKEDALNAEDEKIIRRTRLLEAADGMTTEEAVIRLTYEPNASVKLFFAAKDIPIEEAVRYLEHGREMEKFIKQDCMDCYASGQPTKAQCAPCENGKLLRKLEGK